MITTKKTRIQMQQAAKWERICNYNKKNTITNLEEAWERYAFDRLQNEDLATTKLLKHVTIHSMIDKKANKFYKAWRKNSRLSIHDFQSVLYEKVWHIVGNYSWASDFFLYEHLNKGLDQVCIDLLRFEGLKKNQENKRTHFHKSLSMTSEGGGIIDLPGRENVEFQAHINIWIEWDLDEKERAAAKLLIIDYLATLDDLCDELGLSWRQQAARVKNRIKLKYEAATRSTL